MRLLDLFSGIGGFSLAASWVWEDELEIVAFCEIEKRCQDFLRKHHPDVPIIPDVRDIDGRKYRPIDLLCAGVPCQPASRAGKQRGKEDDRWLWPQALRVVSEARPYWVLFENPLGINDVGLDGILADLEALDYEVSPPLIIPACAVNSPQLRKRYWIVAHRINWGFESERASNREHERGQPAADIQDCLAYGIWPGLEGSEGKPGNDEQERPAPERRFDGHLAHSKGGQDDSRGNGDLEETERRGEGGDPATGGCGKSDVAHNASGHDRRSNAREGKGQVQQSRIGNGKSDMGDAEAGFERAGLCDRGSTGQRGIQSADTGFWSNYVWVSCADGKLRRSPDDSIIMAHGLPVELLEALAEEEGLTEEVLWKEAERFGDVRITGATPHRSLLAALGNSVVPQVVAEIMKAIKEVER